MRASRARKGRYERLTIFLLQECQLRGTHLDNCAGCENLGGTQERDTCADLANSTCREQTTHSKDEGAAKRGARAAN